jgi:hypothetical protein
MPQEWDEKGNPVPAATANEWDEHGNPISAQTAPTMASGSFQTHRGGQIYTDAAKFAKNQQANEKAAAGMAERAVSGFTPGGELTVGAAKGAMSTARNLGGFGIKAIKAIKPDWGEKLSSMWPEAITGNVSENMKPQTVPAKIGFAGEQTAEFALPGPMEEKAAVTLAAKLPWLGSRALPLAKLLTKALSTGAINKAQGGDFGSGAAIGAALPAAGMVAREVAPSLAETALGVTRRMRGFGKTPGEAALSEVEGIRPGTIAENSQQKISALTNELETKAAASQTPMSTAPALAVLDREQAKAAAKNSKSLWDQLQAVREQLTKDFQTGQPIPTQLHPSKGLDLKRGIGDLEKSWNPDQRGATKGIIRKVYGALDKELDNAIPGSEGLNQRISSLITVAKQAGNAERGAGVLQKSAERVARHTGALVGATAGGYSGYRRGGVPGAVAGSLLGLTIPEALSSPTTQMGGARLLAAGPQLADIGRRAILPAKRALQGEQPQR